MIKLLSEMTRADWLTRRWINVTLPGGTEMMFADAGEFPHEQRAALLHLLNGRLGPEPSNTGNRGSRGATTSDEPVAR